MTMNMIVRVPASGPTEQDPRWQDVVARNKAADGRFYYSVKTTGVYCRPSCAARQARPENVQYHLTCEDAEKAGFRPCKRCKPNQPAATKQNAKKSLPSDRAIGRNALPRGVGKTRRHE